MIVLSWMSCLLSVEMLKYFTLVLVVASALSNEDQILGFSEANPSSSCNEICQRNPTSRGTIGQYWIKMYNEAKVWWY